MRVHAADVGERLHLRRPVEEIDAIAAKQREVSSSRQTVPELFELHGRLTLAALAEDVDHFAEGTDATTGEACCQLVEEAAGHALERGRRRVRSVHEVTQGRLGVDREEQAELLDSRCVPPQRSESVRDEVRVLFGRDHDGRLSELEPGRDVLRNRLGELLVLDVDLCGVSRRYVGPGNAHRGSVEGIPAGRGPPGALKAWNREDATRTIGRALRAWSGSWSQSSRRKPCRERGLRARR